MSDLVAVSGAVRPQEISVTESYTQRLNLLKRERTWTVTPRALEWTEEDDEGAIEFADIEAVILKYAPSRFELRRTSMRVHVPGYSVEITNIDWQGPLKSERKSESFLAFVRAFHGALASAGSNPTLRSGRTRPGYFGVLLVTIGLVILSLIGVGLFFFGAPWGVIALKLGLIGVFIPLLIKDLCLNVPRTYVPSDLPVGILRNT